MVSIHLLSAKEVNLIIMADKILYLLGPLTRERSMSWIKRLEIAEDAARGLIN